MSAAGIFGSFCVALRTVGILFFCLLPYQPVHPFAKGKGGAP
jgi:hypothetical protein